MAAKSSKQPASRTAGAKKPKAKKKRWYKQLWAVYSMTRRHDPAVTWWMAGTFVGVIGLAVLLGALTGQWFFSLAIGLSTAVLVPLTIMGRRAERAAYAQIEGRPGAVSAALGTIRRGWSVESEPSSVDPRTQDMVFRAVGRPGIVLVSEGPANRVGKLLDAEQRRISRVLPTVPIHVIQCGRDEGQVPLNRLVRKVQKTRSRGSKLTAAETGEVAKRLKALGSARPPIPKGIDPMRVRPDRKGMRGR